MILYLSVLLLAMGILFISLVYFTKHHKNFKKRDLNDDYMKTVLINYSITCFAFLGLLYYYTYIYRKENTFDFKTILVCLLLIDTIYYWIHRNSHRIPAIRSLIHSTHHEAFDLIPMDIFYLSSYDYCIYLFLIVVFPIYVSNTSMFEHLFIGILSGVHTLYLHDESEDQFIFPAFINSSFHKYHHQIGKGNYSIFFPFWDDYMGTRIKDPAASQDITVKTA